jgi:hypothetical protein
LQINPENRATAYKLKYLIDRSMIPQMETKVKKNNSFLEPAINTLSSECSGLRYIPGHQTRNVEKQKKQKEMK